jgi:hypothetical protein
MIRESITVSATGYARTESSRPITILSFSPGGSGATGFVQVAGYCMTAGDGLAVGDCVDLTFLVSLSDTCIQISPPVGVELAAMSAVRVEFGKHRAIVVQVSGPLAPAVVDWTVRADLILLTTP